MSVASEGQY